MPKATLRVRRKGTAMVPHYEAHPQVRKFHGWKFDPTVGEEFEHPEHKQVMRAGGFVGHDLPIEVPDTVEYRRALRDGDLWPADQATAQAVGIPFDPTFGEKAEVEEPEESERAIELADVGGKASKPGPMSALVRVASDTTSDAASAAGEH
jgi:hypothetical protein